MSPYEVFISFLCVKQHFTKPNYDVFKYNWKTRASVNSFHKRTDRYFFEKISRKKSEREIKDFFVSNFVRTENPKGVYIPDLIKDGEEIYLEWKKYVESISYNFKNELELHFSNTNLNDLMACRNHQHSELIKLYLQKNISLETLVIINEILNYTKVYDQILVDPLWEVLSLKIKKYTPFLSINKNKYIHLLKENICG